MAERPNKYLVTSDLSERLQKIRARTPARILMGRAGAAYRTNVQLELREAHAAARDAVRDEMDLLSTFSEAFVRQWELFQVQTRAAGKDEYLLRPDLGRHFDESSRLKIQENCARGSDLQIVIGDGLSVPAVSTQVPALLPLLYAGAKSAGWKAGRTFVIHYCRVGILNEIGQLLDPRVVVLLIGERPGLATAESLSAYMAYRPRVDHTDADRNLISNIHARSETPTRSAARILSLAAQMMQAEASGCRVKENLQPFVASIRSIQQRDAE
jgi:ethanolamine ammonia-lyase small subunit